MAELLRLMVHSVYSESDIFLRELISNASDACDKLRYEAIAKPALMSDGAPLAVRITPDEAAGTLTIADTGIGMDRQELIDNLGTIARSGTRAFMSKLAEAKDGGGLIGQFGVGFYSAFMVADRIEVTSRRAGAERGMGVAVLRSGAGFEVAPATEEQAERVVRGTAVVLHLKPDAKRYLEPREIERVVRAYSDHILFPIELADGKGDPRQINAASAIWQRSKSELKPEDYTQAYRTIAGAFDEPAMTLHYKAEGRQAYAVLLFAPSSRPFDLFDPDRKGRVKLYVRRVFISDDADLLPPYLRFVRGVIDSEDLPLNISREMLQKNPQVAQIRKAVTGRVIGELETLATKDAAAFGKVWDAFGGVLKEGIYEDHERRDQLLALARFATTKDGGLRSLADYVADLKPNQTDIYYLVGDSIERLKVEPEAGGRPRPRRRGAAAHRSGRCILDGAVARISGQAAQVAEPGRRRFRPRAASRAGRETRGQAGRRRRCRHHRRGQGHARRARVRRARLAAADRQCRVPGGAEARAPTASSSGCWRARTAASAPSRSWRSTRAIPWSRPSPMPSWARARRTSRISRSCCSTRR